MRDETDPIYNDPDKAREYLEALHWPDGPVCPRCKKGDRAKRLLGKSTRPGVVMCNRCRKPFTVTVGTIFEDSKVPLHKWLKAFRLLAGSKKGYSSHQLHRALGVTYKTAWFMHHRVSEAMKSNDPDQFGEQGGLVEMDETFIGRDPDVEQAKKGGGYHKMKVFALIDRDTGRSRAVVVNSFKPNELGPIIHHNVAPQAQLMTDDARHYPRFSYKFAAHYTVNHSANEYVRGQHHTNTIEGWFSIFKRGMIGVYQHCAKHHLQRYLTEFEFRYNYRAKNGYDDTARTDMALLGARGRRLTYRRTGLVSA